MMERANNMKTLRIIFSIVLLHALAIKGQKSDSLKCYFECCRPDALAPAGIMTDHVHEKGKFAIAYGFMFMNMQGNQYGTKAVNNDFVFEKYMMSTQHMHMQMHMLMPMYGITSRLTVMGMINYYVNDMSMFMMPAVSMTMSGMAMSGAGEMPTEMRSYGFGDTKISLLYNLLPENDKRLIAGIGLSLPTGDIDVRGPTMQSDYSIFPYDMQLGTGTWNVLPSLVYVKQAAKFSWGAAFNANIKLGTNSKNYSFGNEYNLSPWLSYALSDWLSFLGRLNYYTLGKLYGYDKEINLLSGNDASANILNYGGQKAEAFLGLNIYCRKLFNGSRLLLEYGVPVYQNTNGLQSTLRSTLSARILFEF